MILAGLGDIVHGLSTDPASIKWQGDITAVIGGLGLMFAKDGNVTGGTVMQPTPPATLVAQVAEKKDAGVQ